MLNPMPINGAAACRLPDPQEREALVLAECSGPNCHNLVYRGDEGISCDEDTGEWFCCDHCHVEWRIQQGDATRCCERGA